MERLYTYSIHEPNCRSMLSATEQKTSGVAKAIGMTTSSVMHAMIAVMTSAVMTIGTTMPMTGNKRSCRILALGLYVV